MKNLLALTVLTAGLLASATASAGTLLTTEQIQTFNFTELDSSAVLSFDGFDSTLGTLNSVHFEYTLDKTLNNAVINISTTASVGAPTPLSATSTTTFTGSGIALLLTSTDTLTTPGFVGVVPGPNLTPFQVGTASTSGIAGGVCLSNDASCGAGNTNLSGYIGGLSLFNITIANFGSQGGSVPPTIFSGNNGSAVGTVKIFYDYTAPTTQVPEPATLGLMGLGLAGFAAFRKKKQA